jgi:hypothetical protein
VVSTKCIIYPWVLEFLVSNIMTKFDRLYTILQKNGGTDTKAMGQTPLPV